MDNSERAGLISALSDAIKVYVANADTMLRKWVSDELKALTELVDERFRTLPIPKDGRDGRDGTDGSPGKDGTNGRDGLDGKEGSPGRDGIDGKNGADGQRGTDGRDGRDAKDGRDGTDGLPGRDALELNPVDGIDFEKSYPIGQWATHNGAMWRCVDGKQWKCMLDALASVDETHDGERTITTVYRWASGKTQEFTRTTADVIYRGIYKAGQEYERGDTVTQQGSLWACVVERTTIPPATPNNKDWRLAVVAGRNGRDGKDAPTVQSLSLK